MTKMKLNPLRLFTSEPKSSVPEDTTLSTRKKKTIFIATCLSLVTALGLGTMYQNPASDNDAGDDPSLFALTRAAESTPIGYSGLEAKMANYTPVSPQAGTLINRINCPVNYSTGAVDVSIPIYTVKTRDFELPITLSCITTGIKSSDKNGFVALGWTLNAEPMVTREVRGLPDEIGYLVFNPNFGSLDANYLKAASEGAWDEMPDIFYFNTPVNSGKFVFKRPLSSSENNHYRPILIPASAETFDFRNPNYNLNSMIMTDAHGTQFTFGDNMKGVELSNSGKGENPSCWKATRITSIGQDNITFDYDDSNIILTSRPEYDYYAVEDEQSDMYLTTQPDVPHHAGYWKAVNGEMEYWYASKSHYDYDKGKYIVDSVAKDTNIKKQLYNTLNKVVKPRPLKQINHPNGKVVFNYELYNEERRVQSIDIYEKTTLIQQIVFTYSLFDVYETNPEKQKRKLDKLTICDKITNKEQIYSFAYEYEYEYWKKSVNRAAIDYWGYYNGYNNTDLVDSVQIPLSLQATAGSGTDDALITIGGAKNRKPDLTYATLYSLKKVNYPGGASIAFTYGLNRYMNSSHEEADSAYIDYAGGLRIETIYETDKWGNNKTREIIYGNSPQSDYGKLLTPPASIYYSSEYKKYYLLNPDTNDKISRRYRVYSSNSKLDVYQTNRNSIFYEDAYEVVTGWNESYKTRYQYETSMIPLRPQRELDELFFPNFLDDWRYTRLSNKYNYIQKDTVLSHEHTDYQELSVGGTLSQTDFSEVISLTMGNDFLFPIDRDVRRQTNTLKGFIRLVPSKITKTEYRGGKQMTTTETFNYPTDNNLYALTGVPKYTSWKDSQGKMRYIKRAYSFNATSADGTPLNVISSMKSKNDLLKPIAEYYYVGSMNSFDLQKTVCYKYAATSGTALPYRLSSVSAKGKNASQFEDLETYNKVDAQGNIIEYTRRDGVTVTVLWGYNYQFPVAEIVNCEYSYVDNLMRLILFSSYEKLQTFTSGTLKTSFIALQSALATQGLQMTYYTYYPTRGIATKTETNGNTTTYSYDGSGKLLEVKDTNGKSIEKHEYNIDNSH